MQVADCRADALACRPARLLMQTLPSVRTSLSGSGTARCDRDVADALMRDVSCLITKALAGALCAFGADRGL